MVNFAPDKDLPVIVMARDMDFDRIIYVIGDTERADAIWEAYTKKSAALAFVGVDDWNAQLSPWPMQKVFSRGEDFAGNGREYLIWLTQRVIPQVESALCVGNIARGIAGYSLSGLFALWALCECDAFSMAGSMSGSLWYTGFIDYLSSHPPKAASAEVYLSLGDREAATKNPVTSAVLDCTRLALDALRSHGARSTLRMNQGNHFVHIPSRVAQGLDWLSTPHTGGTDR